MVVGWYHSHPGFGCWLSGVDINTQQSFEALNQRAVAVVVDPIQSVKGKVVIDAFRLINPQTMMLGQEPRQTTSNLGHLNKPSIQPLTYRKNELEEKMLLNLHKKKWTDGLTLQRFDTHSKTNEQTVQTSPSHPHLTVLCHVRLSQPHMQHHSQRPPLFANTMPHPPTLSATCPILDLFVNPYSPPPVRRHIATSLSRLRFWEESEVKVAAVEGGEGLEMVAKCAEGYGYLEMVAECGEGGNCLIGEMLNLAVKYNKAVQEEDELPPEKLAIANVGRQDAKKHLEEHVSNLMSSNIVQTLGTMLDTVVF
ncbi:Mov34/MPN/PAD-1 family protein [Actinidia rufa]|uniref:Mov34/MPN/PAD-1 family protein n=1 Tax=Actinidia rufa TaxID=165716 RepID=A0A7J0E2Z7_9ERIC|nr:Mov34/MPN/PAD-1 family protein [Actinidia rufa]